MITNEKTEKRMRDLIDILNDARQKYYSGKKESPITDKQYDALLYELNVLEKTTGIKLSGSPIDLVGYEEPELKVRHFAPMLSLKNTKDINELFHFLGEEDGIISWKLDGVSIIIYYKNGIFSKALSRGDGYYGKDITNNVKFMKNVPPTLSINLNIIIRGEGCIRLHDFEDLKLIPEGEGYKNPRNMAAGLINRTTESPLLSYLWFIPHSIVYFADNIETRLEMFEELELLGFKVVPHSIVNNFSLKKEIDRYTNDISKYDFAVDGLVISLNDISLGESRGSTAKYPKHSIAFKWEDKTVLTTVKGMKWSISKTGLLTPVVLLEPVELEGTIVKQANLYNLKRFKDLAIGIGDTVKVYKANKIIPIIEDNLTRSGTEQHPLWCPICKKPTYSVATDKTEKLYCWYCHRK